jgi:hypothetical protein
MGNSPGALEEVGKMPHSAGQKADPVAAACCTTLTTSQ